MAWYRCGGTPSEVLSLPTPSEASGAIARFNTDLTENLLSAVAEFSASQAEGTPTPSTPIPIVGVDKVNFTRCGKNLLPSLSSAVTANHITFSPLSDGAIDIDGTASGNASVDVGRNEGCFLQEGTYYVNITATPYTITVFGIVNGTVTTIKNGGGLFTLTKPTQIFVRVLIASGTTVNHFRLPLQLELENQATDYEPYNGTTALINLGGTYYGGSVDAVTGKITLTHAIEDLGTLNWFKQATNLFYAQNASIKGNSVCTCEIYAYQNVSLPPTRNDKTINTATYFGLHALSVYDTDYNDRDTFKSSLSGKYCVFELATPIVVYASNTAEIPTINGFNQVFADTGDVALKYFETVGHKI